MENWTKIQCGNDEFNLQHISFTLISARSTRNKSTAMAQLRENIENVLNKYWYAVAKELPSPHPDYINKKKSTFSVRGIEQNGEAEVVWEYWYDTNNPGGTFVAQSTHSLSLTKDIIPSIEKLLKQKEESIKKAGLLSFLFELAFDPVNTIFHDDSTKEQSAFSTMKQELSDVYKQYLDEQKFEEQHELLIFFNNGRGLERYLQDKCGFDIFEKEKEINQKLLEYKEKQRKLKNSFNHGENNVEYIIKWFVASNDGKHILAIKGDCESKYRYDCILLRNPEFIDEPQEYDHILVTPAGIVIIETKDWKGTIDINADGKWIRYKEMKLKVEFMNYRSSSARSISITQLNALLHLHL